jgi:DNA-binding response OmpR family regulator
MEKNILIVDDDKLFLRALGQKLLEANYNLITTSKVNDAYVKITNKKFDIVICDLMIDDLTGVDLIRAIKQNVSENIPIIVVSSLDYGKKVIDDLGFVNVYFIHKSKVFEQVVEVIQNLTTK